MSGMFGSLLKDDVKISFVGPSGTGKSLTRRVVQSATGAEGLSCGDFMRKHVEEKYHVDLDQYTGKITADDDRQVDERAIHWLMKAGSKVIDGRTPSMFLFAMEERGILPVNSTLRIFVDCDRGVRARRALPKFRRKPGLEDIKVEEVMELQAQRDEIDEKRLIEIWRNEYGLKSREGLYGVPRPNNMSINTVEMTPEKTLFAILSRLTVISSLNVTSFPLAYLNGLVAIRDEMKPKS